MSATATDITHGDYKVADISQANYGRMEIRMAEHEMPGLMALREEYAGRAHRSPVPASRVVCT